MPELSADDRVEFNDSLNRCRRLVRFLAAGRIAFDEYAENVTLAIVRSPIEGIAECASTIPHALLAPYAEYLRAALLPVDFMPCPRPFLAGSVSPEVFESTRREYRDRYVRLYEIVNQ